MLGLKCMRQQQSMKEALSSLIYNSNGAELTKKRKTTSQLPKASKKNRMVARMGNKGSKKLHAGYQKSEKGIEW